MSVAVRYFIVIIILLFSSCSSNKKTGDEGISVFENVNIIKADKSLSQIPVIIPAQHTNKFWFGFNNDNNNFSSNLTFSDRITKVKSLWSGYRTSYNNRMVFAPVIAEDKIYLLDDRGNLIARNLVNYKKVWNTKVVDRNNVYNFTMGKISYNSGMIFVTTGYNIILAVRADNGQIAWSKTIGSIPVSAIISDSNQLFLSTNDNKTYAFNAKNGQINWVHTGIMRNTGILGAANPVLYKNYVIVCYSSGEIYALSKNDGKIAWSHDLNSTQAIDSDFILNDIDSTPIIAGNKIYVIGNGGLMMAINIADGNVLWQKDLASISDFWVSGDFIYLINNDNQLICIHSNEGAIKWVVNLKKYVNEKKPASRIVYNGLIMAGNHLILTNSNRKIILVAPEDGHIIQTKTLDQMVYHTPVVVDGKIYLQTIGRFSVNLLVMN